MTNFASLLESLEFRERDQNDRAGKGLLVSKHNGVTPPTDKRRMKPVIRFHC